MKHAGVYAHRPHIHHATLNATLRDAVNTPSSQHSVLTQTLRPHILHNATLRDASGRGQREGKELDVEAEFKKWDQDGNGELDRQEVRRVCHARACVRVRALCFGARTCVCVVFVFVFAHARECVNEC